MLKECIEVFKKMLDKSSDKFIIDSYVPEEGTYILVEPKGDSYQIREKIDIIFDKKTREINQKSNSNFENICNYDYNSRIINTNKPMASGSFVSKRIIHSNNYLSFIVKKESLINGKLTNEIIDNYYETLSNPFIKYSKSQNATKIYESVEKELGKVDKEIVEKIRNWIKENIFNLDIDIKGKDYLKIFFEYPIKDYKREGKRYLVPNIYNSNEFNIIVEDNIYGLPNDNMGLNSKKPYLENKTRKITVPYLVDSTNILIQKKFFDYLMNFAVAGINNVYMDNHNNKINVYENGKLPDKDFKGMFLRIGLVSKKTGKEVKIHDYDIITGYKPNLTKKLEFKNILKLDQSSKNISIQKYGEWRKAQDIQEIINDVFFPNTLICNYFTEPADLSIADSSVKNNLLLCRETLFNWMYKGVDNGVYPVLNKISLSLIKGSIKNGYIPKASHQFNLRWSIISYFKGGKDMADIIHDIKDSLRVKINSNVTDKLDNDDEYYFAVGQLVNYLLSKNKGKKKLHSLANPFINGKNNNEIKEKLRKLYAKYSYDLDMNGKRFNNLYAMIIGYLPEDKVNQDLIVGGYLSNNLIYESNKGEQANG